MQAGGHRFDPDTLHQQKVGRNLAVLLFLGFFGLPALSTWFALWMVSNKSGTAKIISAIAGLVVGFVAWLFCYGYYVVVVLGGV